MSGIYCTLLSHCYRARKAARSYAYRCITIYILSGAALAAARHDEGGEQTNKSSRAGALWCLVARCASRIAFDGFWRVCCAAAWTDETDDARRRRRGRTAAITALAWLYASLSSHAEQTSWRGMNSVTNGNKRRNSCLRAKIMRIISA